MSLQSAIAEFKSRKTRIDRALRDGTLTEADGNVLTQSYAFVYKDGRVPTLGYAHSGGVQQDSDSDDTIWCVVTTNEEDRDGDIIEPRGRIGNNYAKNPVWLFGHGDWDMPVGSCKDANGNIMVQVEDERVLQGCRFDLEDPDAHFLHGKIKRGFINATSIAFVPLAARRRTDYEKAQYTNNEIGPLGHHFTKWDHTETSWVPLPSNAGAIRDALDQEKSYISKKFQKTLGKYAALSVNESGGCWGGWCPSFRETTVKKKITTPQKKAGCGCHKTVTKGDVSSATSSLKQIKSAARNMQESDLKSKVEQVLSSLNVQEAKQACNDAGGYLPAGMNTKTKIVSEFVRTCGFSKSINSQVIKSKNAADMTAGQINQELDKIDAERSKLADQMIAEGRGNERPTDYQNKNDPLSAKLNAIANRRRELRIECELRYGPGTPSRLPPKFGPRKKAIEVQAALTDIAPGHWVTFGGEDGQVVAVVGGHARIKFRDGNVEEVPVGKLQRKSVKKGIDQDVENSLRRNGTMDVTGIRQDTFLDAGEIAQVLQRLVQSGKVTESGGKYTLQQKNLQRRGKRKSPLAESSGVAGGYLVENELADDEQKSGMDVEYDQGYTAAWDGRARNTNPYRNDTDPKGVEMKTDWDEGWTVAAKERLAGQKSAKRKGIFDFITGGAKKTPKVGDRIVITVTSDRPGSERTAGREGTVTQVHDASTGYITANLFGKLYDLEQNEYRLKSMRRKSSVTKDDMGEDGAIIDKEMEPDFTPKTSAVEAAKAYTKLKDLSDYFGEGGEGDLSKMDHPGMAKSMKELCDRHLPKAMEHIKAAMYAHHAGEEDESADTLMEKVCKAIGGEGVVMEDEPPLVEEVESLEDKDAADGNLETGEGNLTDRGYIPPEEKDEQDVSEEMGDEWTEEETESTNIEPIEDDSVNSFTDDEVGTDTDNDEILERYDTDKGYKTVRRKRNSGDTMRKSTRKALFGVVNNRGMWFTAAGKFGSRDQARVWSSQAEAEAIASRLGAAVETYEKEMQKDALDVGNVDDSPNDAIIKEEVVESADLMEEMASDPTIPKRYKSILKHRAQRLKEMSDDMEEKSADALEDDKTKDFMDEETEEKSPAGDKLIKAYHNGIISLAELQAKLKAMGEPPYNPSEEKYMDMDEDKDLTDEGHTEYDGGPGAPLTEEGHVEYDGGPGQELDNEGNPAELKRVGKRSPQFAKALNDRLRKLQLLTGQNLN